MTTGNVVINAQRLTNNEISWQAFWILAYLQPKEGLTGKTHILSVFVSRYHIRCYWLPSGFNLQQHCFSSSKACWLTLNLNAFTRLLHVNIGDKLCKQKAKTHAMSAFITRFVLINASWQADKHLVFFYFTTCKFWNKSTIARISGSTPHAAHNAPWSRKQAWQQEHRMPRVRRIQGHLRMLSKKKPGLNKFKPGFI